MKRNPAYISLAFNLTAGIVLLFTFLTGGNASWIVVLALYVAVVFGDLIHLLED